MITQFLTRCVTAAQKETEQISSLSFHGQGTKKKLLFTLASGIPGCAFRETIYLLHPAE